MRLLAEGLGSTRGGRTLFQGLSFAFEDVQDPDLQGLDDGRLGDYTRRSTFKTVVGDVVFGGHGEWAFSRVLQVQFQNVKGHGVDQFKDPRTQVVVAPSDWASGDLIYPYANAR